MVKMDNISSNDSPPHTIKEDFRAHNHNFKEAKTINNFLDINYKPCFPKI
jgi:hypothetical protein